MGTRDLLFIGLVLGGAAGLAASLYPPRLDARPSARKTVVRPDDGLIDTVHRVDVSFRAQWDSEGSTPANKADDNTLLRRLSLSLTGSIPSLEEIRNLETLPGDQRVGHYTEALLNDRRFADYFAERFARAYVGTEGGPFLLFRRRRFVTWLSDQLVERTPYDEIARKLIHSDGIWTDKPAVNFVTVTYDPEKKYVDAERVAGRVARAFLGVRIDCAQCHDHPFAPWKQANFQGLAAYFGHVTSGITGVYQEREEYEITDRKTGNPRTFTPRVPFLPELLPANPNLPQRERLARWVTNPKNPNFSRATVNRVWALMFGRPLVDPVDDLTAAEELPEPLTILADDFVAHGYDLRRLVRVIATSQVFRLDSVLPEGRPEPPEKSWAVFPMTRLRPEQVVGGLLQAVTLTTIDADSNILVRLGRVIGENDFVKRYGDSGEDEFDGRGGTIPQRLLMMNGDLVKDRTKPGIFNAATRIGYFARDDEAAVKTCYLTVLTRQPTPDELRHFTVKLGNSKGEERGRRMADILWTLVNSSEFSWNH
jgi:Protein of unknown function (DUF1549)/Protein of unknown function (DUF1553)